MERLSSRRLSSLLAFFVLCPITYAQGTRSPEASLREYYYRGDVEIVAFEGKSLVEDKNASLETRARFVTQAAYPTTQWYRWPIAAILEGMKQQAPSDPWTLVAQSAVVPNALDRIALCERALSASTNVDILVLCVDTVTYTITGDAVGTVGNEQAVAAFVEKYRERMESTSDGMTAYGLATLRATGARERGVPQSRDHVYAILDRALAIDPKNERAFLIKAQSYTQQRRNAEVVKMLERAAERKSFLLHRPYVNSVNQLEMPDDEKARLMEASIVSLIRKGAPGPRLLSDLLNFLHPYSQEAETRIAKLAIELHPDSAAAESMVVRLIDLSRSPYTDWSTIPTPTLRQVASDALEFLKRPTHKNPFAVQSASELLSRALLAQKQPDPAQLFLATELARDDYGYKFVRPLLDSRLRAAEVRQLCRRRLDEMMVNVHDRSVEWKNLSVGKFVEINYWNNISGWFAALGYSELKLGQFDAAARSLERAARLSRNANDDVDLQIYLGALAQSQKKFDDAEARYNQALSAWWDYSRENPAIPALRKLYVARNGTANGIDRYIAAAYEKDNIRRRNQLLATRHPVPKVHPVFSLKSVDGKIVSSSDFKGKFTVVNIWGVWCPPCVTEMPMLQRAYDKYKDDPRIGFVTIDTRDGIGLLKSFLTRNRLSLPVLLGTDYVVTAGVDTFPTTWLLDKEGRIVFTYIGAMEEIELQWMIEALIEAR